MYIQAHPLAGHLVVRDAYLRPAASWSLGALVLGVAVMARLLPSAVVVAVLAGLVFAALLGGVLVAPGGLRSRSGYPRREEAEAGVDILVSESSSAMPASFVAGPLRDGWDCPPVGGDHPRRLLVELNARSWAELGRVTALEGLSPSTIVNRAIQVYGAVASADHRGASVLLLEQDGTANRFRLR
jgi:hypothetical protein